MLKILMTATLVVTLTASLQKVTFGDVSIARAFASTASTSIAIPPTAIEDAPFCFMRTPDGRTLDLTQLCETGDRQDQDAAATEANTPAGFISPQSNLGGLRATAEATGCFGLDAEGRPCPPVP